LFGLGSRDEIAAPMSRLKFLVSVLCVAALGFAQSPSSSTPSSAGPPLPTISGDECVALKLFLDRASGRPMASLTDGDLQTLVEDGKWCINDPKTTAATRRIALDLALASLATMALREAGERQACEQKLARYTDPPRTAPAPSLVSGKYAPLPAQIMTARKVAFVSFSDQPQIVDDAFKALHKWGRFQMVADRSEADLIIAIATEQTGEERREVRFGRDTVTTTANPTLGTYTSTYNPAPSIPVRRPTGNTTLSVFDAKAPNVNDTPALWRVTVPWGDSGKRVIDELKKRVAEQEKQ